MAQRAGRVGVNPADVNPVTGHINVQVPGNVYTKTQVDNKFLTKTKAASDYQTKELSVPIELLDGSALTVETALQGLNSQKQDKHLSSPMDTLVGSQETVEDMLAACNGYAPVQTINVYDNADPTTVIGVLSILKGNDICFIRFLGNSVIPSTPASTYYTFDLSSYFTGCMLPIGECVVKMRNFDVMSLRTDFELRIYPGTEKNAWSSGFMAVPVVKI